MEVCIQGLVTDGVRVGQEEAMGIMWWPGVEGVYSLPGVSLFFLNSEALGCRAGHDYAKGTCKLGQG